THTHPFLSELDGQALRDELRRSREILDERLEQRTTMLALPGGDIPRGHLWPILAEEYEVIATSRWGVNASSSAGTPRLINRCTVRGEYSPALFESIVTADHWLGLKQQARQGALSFLRSSLGPSRYARFRR